MIELSYGQFYILYVISLAVAAVVGLFVILGPSRIRKSTAIESLKHNWVYLPILAVVPAAMLAENRYSAYLGTPQTERYTEWMYDISGQAVRLIQERFERELLTDFFTLFYVWVFTFIMYFTPLLFLVGNERDLLKRYCVAVLFVYMFLIPFYLFFPVKTPATYDPAGIDALLYDRPYWGRIVTSMDPLDNDFPSGHVALTMTTVLLLSTSERLRRYFLFTAASIVAIVMSVLYLGIHWIPDVFAGFFLAVGGLLFVSHRRAMAWLEARGGAVRRAGQRLVHLALRRPSRGGP